MKRTGLDSLESWVVAVSCSLVFLLGTFPARFGSQLFIAILEYYDATRKAASFPFSMAFLVRSLSGPLAGYVGQKIGLTTVTLIGCLFNAVAMFGCFFAHDLIAIDVFFGIFYGIGYGLSTALIPEIINHHFLKYRGMSNGFVTGVASFGIMVGPPIMDIVLNYYGVSGTFLIISAVLLNGVPAMNLVSILMPQTEKEVDQTQNLNQLQTIQNKGKIYVTQKMEDIPSVAFINCDKDFIDDKNQGKFENSVTKNGSEQKFLSKNQVSKTEDEKVNPINTILNAKLVPVSKVTEKANTKLSGLNEQNIHGNKVSGVFDTTEKTLGLSNCHLEIMRFNFFENKRTLPYQHKDQQSNQMLQSIQRKNDFNLITHTNSLTMKNSPVLLNFQRLPDFNPASNINENGKTTKQLNSLPMFLNRRRSMLEIDYYNNILKKNSGSKPVCDSFNILWNPIFLILTFLNSCHSYVMYVFYTITIDIVRDKSDDKSAEVYTVMAQGLADMTGKFVLSSLVDFGLLSEANYAAFCFAIMGFGCMLLTFVSGTYLTMIFICVISLAVGGNSPGVLCIVSRFIKKEKRPMAMACRLIVYAPMSFTMSPLIGYFREDLGSYDGLLYILAVFCSICCLLLLFLPKMVKFSESRQNSIGKG